MYFSVYYRSYLISRFFIDWYFNDLLSGWMIILYSLIPRALHSQFMS